MFLYYSSNIWVIIVGAIYFIAFNVITIDEFIGIFFHKTIPFWFGAFACWTPCSMI